MGRKRDTGGRVEVFLLRRVGVREIETEPTQTRSAEIWRALGKASKPLKFGADVEIARRGAPAGGGEPTALCARLLGRSAEDGLLEVALWTPSGEPSRRRGARVRPRSVAAVHQARRRLSRTPSGTRPSTPGTTARSPPPRPACT